MCRGQGPHSRLRLLLNQPKRPYEYVTNKLSKEKRRRKGCRSGCSTHARRQAVGIAIRILHQDCRAAQGTSSARPTTAQSNVPLNRQNLARHHGVVQPATRQSRVSAAQQPVTINLQSAPWDSDFQRVASSSSTRPSPCQDTVLRLWLGDLLPVSPPLASRRVA